MADNNFTKVLRILSRPFQDIENMWQQLLWGRTIDNATGVTLTNIGKLVGQARLGVTDDEVFRRYVRARVVINRSRGTVKDLIKICQLVVYDDAATYQVLPQNYATVVVCVSGVDLSADLAALLLDFLQDAAAGGVRVILEYSAVDPSLWFTWDVDGLGWDDGYLVGAIA